MLYVIKRVGVQGAAVSVSVSCSLSSHPLVRWKQEAALRSRYVTVNCTSSDHPINITVLGKPSSALYDWFYLKSCVRSVWVRVPSVE